MAAPQTTPTPAGPASRCPNCMAPVEPGQLSCLECGTALGVRYRRPADWRAALALVGAVVLLIGIALGLGLEAVRDDPPRVASAPPSPPPKRTAPLPTEGEQRSPAGGGAEEEPLPPASDPGQPPAGMVDSSPSGQEAGGGGSGSSAAPGEGSSAGEGAPGGAGEAGALTAWPSGKSGFTVVLASETNRAAAEAKARRAVAAGLSAGVLRSSDYRSLNPGYWVAFAGQFDSMGEARSSARSAAAKGFPQAYARAVDPA